MRRRDFLFGAGAIGLSAPLAARAAFAQGAPAGRPPADTVVARIAIYPALGICRVGSSPDFFYAPEVPGLPAVADGRYKDGHDHIRKQAQRFRIYGFNAAGEVLGEVTAGAAKIEWSVHVANTKAAWYGFNNPLDNGELAPGLPGQLRNQGITAAKDRAEMLVIDAGVHRISGTGVNAKGLDPAHAMVGRFWKRHEVTLAALGTDEAGRLIVFPGNGVAQSAYPNNPITNFSDNDGWYDDWCDGPVEAKVTLGDGRTLVAENAWVACCGPDFAPEIPPFITLYDVMTDTAIAGGWATPPKPPYSFRRDIYPFFRRLALTEWVAAAAALSRQYVDVGDLNDPAYIARLADPSPANRALREKVLSALRDPAKDPITDPSQVHKLPFMPGDGINYSASPLRWFRIPERQYAILRAWAEGAFVADLDPTVADPAITFADIPLAQQPEALTRAALEPCSGGAFHPGVELTWTLRHPQLYRGAYRIRKAENRDPTLLQDLGLLLTPDRAFGGMGRTPPAVAPQMPGDLTRWMGLPWQCDAFSCQHVAFANDFPAAAWWPALLPIDVLPEINYNALMDPNVAPADRLRFFGTRAAWSRGSAGIGYHAQASYSDGLNRMIYLWERMGFVVSRPGPQDPGRPKEIPAKLFVEMDRGSMDLVLNTPPFPGIIPPPKR
ncbi:CTQ-dependent glycine oxidase GoxA [Azorhizobium sp. AG788]|uniref:CTQ-dependent glycine oxidase GoxA n=1 Tax=Azorhizobium sp. AG788 TaxID=2183897 RepID=UPI003139CE6B